MRISRLVALAFLLLPLTLSAEATAIGNWKAVFVGPIGDRPKMVDTITFTIAETFGGLKATAHAGNWPGDLAVSELKVDGDHVSFTGTGSEGWSVNRIYHCCPKLVFAGTVNGDAMDLTMTWQTTEGADDPAKPRLPMQATRLSK